MVAIGLSVICGCGRAIGRSGSPTSSELARLFSFGGYPADAKSKAMFCDSNHIARPAVALRIFHTNREKSDGQDDSSSQVVRAPN
jgi:hypothetical protein